MMFDILLKHAYVITMDQDRRIIEDGAVGIKDGKIVFVGENEEAKNHSVVTEIDLSDHVVMPGFVDAHGHGGHSIFKSIVKDTSYLMPVMTHTYKNSVSYTHLERLKYRQMLHRVG